MKNSELTKEALAKLKVRVEKKLARTKDDIVHLTELTQPIAPENSLGRLTRMDALNNKSVNEATLRQAQYNLGRLEHVLHRIENEDPTLGTCATCNEVIPLPRIMLMPESENCVKCAK